MACPFPHWCFFIYYLSQELQFNILGQLLFYPRKQQISWSKILSSSFYPHTVTSIDGTHWSDLDPNLWLSDWPLLYVVLEHFHFPWLTMVVWFQSQTCQGKYDRSIQLPHKGILKDSVESEFVQGMEAAWVGEGSGYSFCLFLGGWLMPYHLIWNLFTKIPICTEMCFSPRTLPASWRDGAISAFMVIQNCICFEHFRWAWETLSEAN